MYQIENTKQKKRYFQGLITNKKLQTSIELPLYLSEEKECEKHAPLHQQLFITAHLITKNKSIYPELLAFKSHYFSK